MKLLHSGLPIHMRDADGILSFEEGLLCDGSSSKNVGQMAGLLKNPDYPDKDERMYDAYRNIRFPEHEELFKRFDFRYDITAIQPGTVNGEFKKTSGHYHGYIAGGLHPYPEVYEVIRGEILFILQNNQSIGNTVYFFHHGMQGSPCKRRRGSHYTALLRAWFHQPNRRRFRVQQPCCHFLPSAL